MLVHQRVYDISMIMVAVIVVPRFSAQFQCYHQATHASVDSLAFFGAHPMIRILSSIAYNIGEYEYPQKIAMKVYESGILVQWYEIYQSISWYEYPQKIAMHIPLISISFKPWRIHVLCYIW